MRKTGKKQVTYKRLPLVAALMGCLYGPLVLAQDQAQDDDKEETKTEATTLDRITVTGSLLKRLQYDSASPVQVITADTSVEIGQVDVADMLQSSSVASGSTQINHQFSGFVVEGGLGVQTVSLRGIGAQRSLVLLDGRRPGPAGVRGSVGAFDLNVIPSSILQRAEILKDGSSSIYGSDAIAGVINLITRRSVDEPTVTVQASVPMESGGESYSVSAATGWNFESGNIVLAAEWYKHEALKRGDRDFLRCGEDLVWGPNGERIDRADGSILAGTELAGCNNLYANTVIDLGTGARYIPSPDGVTIGLMPGYRPRVNPTYATTDSPYYEDVLNFDFLDEADAINEQDRKSVYAAADFTFGDVNWYGKALYNNRSTTARGYRQFFPFIAPFYADDPGYQVPVPSG
ncbi:MAG TPA: TonB-dependent receptor plug domain-containing protein, partial [Arenimonas sp.]|nr:TonB-dependent receptor plug domain-containing protein [Arenimonas sp.]